MKDRQMFRLGFFCRSAIASALLFFILSVFATANVLTWHNDDARTGRNLSEKILTPSNVNSAGAANALVDPMLELHDISGTLIASNDNAAGLHRDRARLRWDNGRRTGGSLPAALSLMPGAIRDLH